MGTNHLARLIESYRLATEQPPPAGFVLVHGAPQAHGAPRRLRAWWATPAAEFVVCTCAWRPDLGEHHRVQRASPLSRRRGRRRVGPASLTPLWSSLGTDRSERGT